MLRRSAWTQIAKIHAFRKTKRFLDTNCKDALDTNTKRFQDAKCKDFQWIQMQRNVQVSIKPKRHTRI